MHNFDYPIMMITKVTTNRDEIVLSKISKKTPTSLGGR